MANNDNARGFQPVKPDGSYCDSGQVTAYLIPSTDSTAVFVGDPVIANGTASVPTVSSEFEGHYLPQVIRATAGSGAYTTGVVVGVEPIEQSSTTYRAASTERVVYVNDDPNQMFEIQEDSDGGALAAVNTGQNADFIIGTGSTVTGLSAAEIDSGTADTTATLQLRLERLVPRSDNTVGNYAKWLVRFNLHQKRNTTGI
jgi:hypothetical protein